MTPVLRVNCSHDIGRPPFNLFCSSTRPPGSRPLRTSVNRTRVSDPGLSKHVSTTLRTQSSLRVRKRTFEVTYLDLQSTSEFLCTSDVSWDPSEGFSRNPKRREVGLGLIPNGSSVIFSRKRPTWKSITFLYGIQSFLSLTDEKSL